MAESLSFGVMHIHGMVTNTYHVWRGMRNRCANPNNPNYPDYGARGITVCERWANSFTEFHSDMGERPSVAHSIERIDNNGPYSPDNCKWGTKTEQARNTRVAVLVDIDGETVPLKEAADRRGLDYNSAIHKIYRGAAFDAVSRKIHQISETEAGEIKWLLANTGHSTRSIAHAYDVCAATVGNIRKGKHWTGAAPVPTDREIPPSVSAKAAPYLMALSRWRSPVEVRSIIGLLPQGFLMRLHLCGLAEHNTETGLFRATANALEQAALIASEQKS